MTDFNIYKRTAVPSAYEKNDVYFVSSAANSDHFEIYVANSTGDSLRRLITGADVDAKIVTALSAHSSSKLKADIAERDAMTDLNDAQIVIVEDASDDPTVASGSATYAYDLDNDVWIKLAEFENMDLSLEWSSIQNGPTSSPIQIDEAVGLAHTHDNKTQLDLIGQDTDGNFTYDGQLPATGWGSTDW